jgi:TolB-like protein/Flp pilus assembly protein TadD
MTRQRETFYQFGPFHLDAAERKLLRDGQPVPLSPKVFDTLIAFVENPGRLIQKDELMTALWPDTFVGEGTLARNISDLRKALRDASGGATYIETVPKIGYRFVARVTVADKTDSMLIVHRRTKSRVLVEEEIPESHSIGSIAVLPFNSLTAGDVDDYLPLGLADALITRLTKIRRIGVRPTSAIARYVGSRTNPIVVGQEIGVDSVLDGNIQRAGDRIRVTVQLVNVSDGSVLWAEKFDERFTEIFAVEDSISEQVARAVVLELTADERKLLRKRYTDNTDAYQLYLKGRYHWNKRATESLNKGLDYFKQAIALDPGFASAHSGMSDSYTLLVVREAVSPAEGFAKAKSAAAMALEIDEEFAEAHASMGHAMLHNWEWDEAEVELRKAIERNPGYPSAHHWYSEHLTAMGRCDESIAELKLAAGLDPLSLIISADLGRAFYYAREYDQLMKQEAKTLELDPNFWLSHINLGRSYIQKGMHTEAISELQRACELSVGNTESRSFLGYAYAAAGRRDYALETLRELEEQSKHSYVPPYHLAIIHAGLGKKERALEWLERAFENHAVDLFTLKVEPMFDSLRSDPRFEDLLRRVGLIPPDSTGSKFNFELTRRSLQSKPAGIAVLPFKPINPVHRDEYLELGIADAVIARLSDINRIVVRPTSSVRKYTDLEQDAVAAGRELAVESVLEGSIQKLDDRIRVTARLLKVEDGSSLWTGKFDESFTDIFSVEDSISERVAAALSLKLTGDERERLTKRYTENTAAYHLYLKGRYYWSKRSEEALHKAVACFDEAVAIDETYALAYAGLSDCYTKLGDVGVTAIAPREAFARARQAALKALEIDSALVEVHASLGHLEMHHLHWRDAEKEFKRAMELNPAYATARQWHAYFMAFHRRFDEALEEIEVALKLDPLSLPIADAVGEFLYFARRHEEALEQFKKVLEMDSSFLPSRIHLGRVYEQVGLFGEAEEQFINARNMTGESIDALAALGHTYAMSGNNEAARGVLARLTELSTQRYVSLYEVALIHAALGEIDEAFRSLERAYDERAEWMIYTNVDPRLDPLRADPRFGDLLGRLGFAPERKAQ